MTRLITFLDWCAAAREGARGHIRPRSRDSCVVAAQPQLAWPFLPISRTPHRSPRGVLRSRCLGRRVGHDRRRVCITDPPRLRLGRHCEPRGLSLQGRRQELDQPADGECTALNDQWGDRVARRCSDHHPPGCRTWFGLSNAAGRRRSPIGPRIGAGTGRLSLRASHVKFRHLHGNSLVNSWTSRVSGQNRAGLVSVALARIKHSALWVP